MLRCASNWCTSKLAFSFNLRRYTMALFEPLPAELKYALTRNFGRAVQVDGIKTHVESSLWFQRLRAVQVDSMKTCVERAYGFSA